MSQTNFRSALVKALVDADLGIELVSQNAKTTPLNDEPWALVTFQPDDSPEPVTLGTTGEDEALGTLGVQLNYPNDLGPSSAMAMADRICEIYRTNKHFEFGGHFATVDNAGYQVAGTRGAYFRINVRISWRGRLPRVTTT